jgi:lambda repressor-like predicted transcriptional regulator
MRPKSDPTKLVDDWPLPNLSANHRKKIKAVLLKAHAAFHRGDFQDPYRFIQPMQQSFDGIARVLFEAALLTVAVMENELRKFVIDSAASGRWLNPDQHERVTRTIFEAEIAEWSGKLLEYEAAQAPDTPGHKEAELAASNPRRAFVLPLLEQKGWSILDWANEANVSHATAQDYLDNKTKPYPSTRKKLANALGINTLPI